MLKHRNIAGVEVGDIILKVNNRRTRRMKLQDITRKMARKSGKKVKLTLKRDDEQVKTEFILSEWFERR